MAIWREKLFVLMARNAVRATAFFRLPPERVVVRGGESLRGTEKLEVVGVFETQLRRADVTGTAGA